MKRVLISMIVLLLVPIAGAAEEDASSEAVEILQRVDRAIKAVDAVRLTASVVPTGIATNFMSAAEGESIMIGWNGAVPERFYVHVKTKDPATGDVLELTGGGDGETYFIIDHAAKKAYEDMDPAVMGSHANTLRGMGMIEFVHDRPFDDELGADEVKLEGTGQVAGEECYEIHVVYAGGQGESTWFFSKKDYLPRRRIRHFTVPNQGEGALEITVTKLEVAPKVEPTLFKLDLPEGYEQIDDFAP